MKFPSSIPSKVSDRLNLCNLTWNLFPENAANVGSVSECVGAI
jgi:hypothetical protein